MQLQFTKVLQLSLAIPPRLDAMSVSKSRYANRHNVMSGWRLQKGMKRWRSVTF